MQQVARYHDAYSQPAPHHHHHHRHPAAASHQSAPAPVQRAAPLYDVVQSSSPGSVESPPGATTSTSSASSASDQQPLPATSSFSNCQFLQQQQQHQLKSAVTSSGMQQASPQQQNSAASSAVDYSNGSGGSSSSGGRLDGGDASVIGSSYMPVYCLPQPSHTVTSSDVYHHQHQYQLDDQHPLKLRMQEQVVEAGVSCSTAPVTTPEVISMLKPDFADAANQPLYMDEKMGQQEPGGGASVMRDLSKPSSDLKFGMETAHCSSINQQQQQSPLFQQIPLQSFGIHDDRVGAALSNVSGTVHHLGYGDLHATTALLPQHQIIGGGGGGGGIKAEPPPPPMMVGGSPPVSPIDMDHQEAIKSERKRMRNRIAAHKCRRRKLERISKLEDKVASLKNHNAELNSNINMLKQQVTDLKAKVLDHVNQGCEILLDRSQILM